jgi:hypothetical protein
MEPERVAELTRRASGGAVDLTDQKTWISRAVTEGQGWGEIQLDPSDNVRALKRRTTMAGKDLHKVVKWHRKSTPDCLIFQALDPDQIVKRHRTQRTANQQTASVGAAEASKRRSRKS